MSYRHFALRIFQTLPAMLVAAALLLAPMQRIHATNAPSCTATPSGATISVPATSIAPNTPNGLIGQPSQVSVSFNCLGAFDNTPNYYDDFTVLAGQLAALDTVASPTGSGLMFKTNMTGIDVLLTATPAQASSGNNGPNGTQGWAIQTINCTSATGGATGSCSPNPISATFTAQLVKIGPVTPGTISSISLLRFFDSDYVPPNPPGYGNTTTYSTASTSFGTLTLNAINVTVSTCTIVAGSQNVVVTLPTISTRALASTGAVAGETPFSIQYTCPSGWSLYMTMTTANPGSAPGVILSPATCSGKTSATNVGVQLLQGNQQAMQFNTAQSVGNSPNGTLTIPYYAQYYANNTPIGAGPVCATATFTLSYQ